MSLYVTELRILFCSLVRRLLIDTQISACSCVSLFELQRGHVLVKKLLLNSLTQLLLRLKSRDVCLLLKRGFVRNGCGYFRPKRVISQTFKCPSLIFSRYVKTYFLILHFTIFLKSCLLSKDIDSSLICMSSFCMS